VRVPGGFDAAELLRLVGVLEEAHSRFAAGREVWAASALVDMRRAFIGLAEVVREQLAVDVVVG
jgi:VanZ family protein